MVTHSSTLAQKIPWIEGPGRLQCLELQRVGHNWATELEHASASLWAFPSNELIHIGAHDLDATILLKPKFKGEGDVKQIETGSLNDHVELNTPEYLNYSLSLLPEKKRNFLKPQSYC